MQATPDILEDVLERGDLASALLENSTFVEVMNDLSTFHLAAMTACKPGETDKPTRDYHHTMLYALREIGDELVSRKAAAEELRRRLGIDNEDFE